GIADSLPKGHHVDPDSGNSTYENARARPDNVRRLETKKRPYRNISTADNTASSLTALRHRHRNDNARRQSAWLPCGCKSWGHLLWLCGCFCHASCSLPRCLTQPLALS